MKPSSIATLVALVLVERSCAWKFGGPFNPLVVNCVSVDEPKSKSSSFSTASPSTSTDSTSSTGSAYWSYPLYRKLVAQHEELEDLPNLKLECEDLPFSQVIKEDDFITAVCAEDYALIDQLIDFLYKAASRQENLPTLPKMDKSLKLYRTVKLMRLKKMLEDMKREFEFQLPVLMKQHEDLVQSAQKTARRYRRSALKMIADEQHQKYESMLADCHVLVEHIHSLHKKLAKINVILGEDWFKGQYLSAYEADME